MALLVSGSSHSTENSIENIRGKENGKEYEIFITFIIDDNDADFSCLWWE